MSVQNAAVHQSQFAKDMAGQFSNSKRPEAFINQYFPRKADGSKSKPLRNVSFPKETIASEEKWATFVNENGLCPSLTFFCTKDANSGSPSMNGEKARPDLAAFPADMSPAEVDLLVMSNFEELFGRSPLLVERKLSNQDGFRDKPDKYIGVEKQTDTSEHVRGQLIMYAMHQHHQQPRVASYQVLLIDEKARLLRFDRAGVVCTDLFTWTSGTILADFLSRFDEANRAERGYDPTATPATSGEIDAAKVAFHKAGYGKTHAMRGPFYKFEVPAAYIDPAVLKRGPSAPSPPSSSADDIRIDAPMRYFIAGCPISWSSSFTGRAGTGYICHDILEKGVHFMKDAWRIDEPSLLAEYQVYALLGEEISDSEGVKTSVPHVPQLMCGGDLRNVDGKLQKTLTEVVDAAGNSKGVQQYTHFRMVLKDIGNPLPSFEKVPDLLTVVRDVVVAHQYALKRGILHRDISAGNILIVKDKQGRSRGLLIDWDLCFIEWYADADEKRWITFLSIALLSRRKGHRHSEHDDLESVFWVLCYCLARYTNLYNGSHKALVDALNACFDYSRLASRQREDRPEQQQGGDVKEKQLKLMAQNDSDAPKTSDFLPKETHAAIRLLLGGLAGSLDWLLQDREARSVLRRFDSPPKKHEEGYNVYRRAKSTANQLKDLADDTFPFTHDNFVKTIDAALALFQTAKVNPKSPPPHGSQILGDRVKLHQEAKREKEEKERSRSMQERSKEANGEAKSVKAGSKRLRSEDNDVPHPAATRPRLDRAAKKGSSRKGSSRRDPSEPTVHEESE
ncbi:hypothetical protein PENSPDRAFT_87769 [Peniophora sp. CONT]|nr:hypothetical protein PENSPDRAFT_87769 [Peniophora sp. CONT]